MRDQMRILYWFIQQAWIFYACAAVLSSVSCRGPAAAESPETWKKIQLDFKRLDENGLAGPIGGKVAVNYEFCLPASEKYWKKVKNLDKTAVRQPGAKGRVGCNQSQWLVIGSTHQANYQRVLYQLASLPYIERIQQTFWE